MLPEEKAVVWRGPMLMGALQQMLTQVEWGELDVLLVDLPPGTGDVQLTLCQKSEVTGAIVVSTPQDVALLDARKALDMFEHAEDAGSGPDREHVDAMSAPIAGTRRISFGQAARRLSARCRSAREAGDAGTPIAAGEGPMRRMPRSPFPFPEPNKAAMRRNEGRAGPRAATGDRKARAPVDSRFQGESLNKVDGKGRISLPAKFRRALQAGDSRSGPGGAARLYIAYGNPTTDNRRVPLGRLLRRSCRAHRGDG
jgi:hypothetical protein